MIADQALLAVLAEQSVMLKLASIHMEPLRGRDSFAVEELWGYRIPIGLALAGFRPSTHGLFHHLCQVKEATEDLPPFWTLQRAAVLFILALAALGGVLDASYRLKEKRLVGQCETLGVAEYVKEKQVQKMLAQYRPDMLDLLKQIQPEDLKGVVIDSFRFERGQPVRITAHADKVEQVYEFEEALAKRAGIKFPKLEKVPKGKDPKTKQYNFTLSLHYKNFTKRTSAHSLSR